MDATRAGRGVFVNVENWVTAVILQLDPINLTHNNVCTTQRIMSTLYLKTRPILPDKMWGMMAWPSADPWRITEALDDVLSVHAWAVTRSLPIKGSRLPFCSIIVYSLRTRPHVYPIQPLWWITTFIQIFWTCKLPADQKGGSSNHERNMTQPCGLCSFRCCSKLNCILK